MLSGKVRRHGPMDAGTTRRSPRGIKSTRRVGALLRLVVCALSVDAAVSAGVGSVSIAEVNHTQPRVSHVGAAQRLPEASMN